MTTAVSRHGLDTLLPHCVSQQLGFEKYNEATLESCNCSDLLLKKIGKFGIEEEEKNDVVFF